MTCYNPGMARGCGSQYKCVYIGDGDTLHTRACDDALELRELRADVKRLERENELLRAKLATLRQGPK